MSTSTASSIQRAILVFLFLIQFVGRNEAAVFDITTKGAKADGATDAGAAMMAAWKEACASAEPSSVLMPKGKYKAHPPITFAGPCKSAIEVQATGAEFIAPPDPKQFQADSWIEIRNVEKLTFIGGTFDGQGQQAWKENDCAKNGACKIPMNLRLSFVKNSLFKGVTSLNSKFFHINLLACDGTTLDSVTIDAPGESINTDGIHLGRLNGVNITNAKIKTGDDCISFGDGSKNVHVTGVTCGPGHGISIGSLGRYPNEEPVEGIWIKNATITGTMNGVRIKSWPGAKATPNTVTDVHFEDIRVENVGNPVLIDQEYCPYEKCEADTNPSKVKISKVSFKNIKGTSSTKAALNLICSKANPCAGVEVSDIDLKYTGPEGGEAVSQCDNIQPTLSGTINPKPCTAPPGPLTPGAAGTDAKKPK